MNKKIKIIADSCCDLDLQFSKEHNIDLVPLKISINNLEFIDDENLDINCLLKEIETSTESGKSACPSPQDYIEKYEGHDEIFVVTLSSIVSGSYGSATIAKNIYIEDNPNTKIHVINSYSASACEIQIVHKLIEFINADMSFDDIVPLIDTYTSEIKTYFVLDDMETLIKNGRIKGLKAFLIGRLNIKAIMSQKNGEIINVGSGRGITKTIINLAKIVDDEATTLNAKKLFITKINADDKVDILLNKITYKFEDVIINSGHGISTLYANKGGLIISFR